MISDELVKKSTPWLPVPPSIGKWTVSQVKYHYDVILGKMLQNTPSSPADEEVPYLKAQHVQWDGPKFDDLPTMWASPNDIDSLTVQEGDLLVCEGGEVGRAALVYVQPPDKCIIQNALHLVRPKETGDLRFLKYLLRHATTAEWLEVLCNRATIAHFTAEKFRELWIWLPPLAQQRAIANYLDDKTAEIDELLTAKQELLTLLAEKRSALITHAVTRGLAEDVPLRDSGEEIWGNIPKHWQVVHLRRVLSSLDYGISESVGPDGNVGVLRMGDIYDGEINYQNVGFVDDVDKHFLLEPGDLLFNRTNSLAQVGKVGLFRGKQEFPVSFASYLVRLRCNEYAIPEYLNYLLNSSPSLTWARAEALPSIGQVNLNPGRYSYLPIPLPPIQEQNVVVRYLSESTKSIDELQSVTQQTMLHLQERRTALIAAAVTGQVQVATL